MTKRTPAVLVGLAVGAGEVHVRQSTPIDDLIARSSIGGALADVKARGIDAHLIDLERELNRPHRHKRKRA